MDSNVRVHLLGAPHVHKAESQVESENLVAARERLVCDAEVLRESYSAIDRRNAIRPACNVFLSVVDEVFSIERKDVLRAASIVTGDSKFSALDAIHRWPGLHRLPKNG